MITIACSASAGGAPGSDDGRLRVVTTVSPITNIVQNVGGPAVSITGIVPEGANSHTFEPAPSDAAVMEQADIVFLNGLGLEQPSLELAEANAGDEVPIVQLGEATIGPDEYIFDFSFPESEGEPNPHLWTNPVYVKRYAEIVGRELRALDPDNAAEYERNVDAFGDRIDELDHIVREVTEYRAGREPGAADLPRLLPLLRAGVRVAHRRRGAALGLLRPDAAGGDGPDRPDRGQSRSRRSSARRSSRARCSSRSPPRPAPPTSTICATTTSPGKPATPITATSV